MSGAALESRSGQVLEDRWTIETKLGAGGMGEVWRARDREGKSAAIKLLRTELVDTPDMFARFRQEVDAASRLGHPHIIEVLGFGHTRAGRPYYAMEFLDGPDLLAMLKAKGPMPWRRAFALAEQICSALHAAHQAGIIHRDVKPENFVLIEDEAVHGRDFVKVLDFGIAKLTDPELAAIETRTGVNVGTPEYMAPEQCEGHVLDARVDVYGVGVLLYQLVVGKPPFEGADEYEILGKHVHERPVPPSEARPDAGVPKMVDAVILQALEKDREHRFADMQRFARSLAAARGREHEIPVVDASPGSARARGRAWMMPAMVGVVALAAVIGVLLAIT
ncbi:serine/threonine-protein kinase [Nannocystaceae bacterium ST9]